jgi:hypothetical protein
MLQLDGYDFLIECWRNAKRSDQVFDERHESNGRPSFTRNPTRVKRLPG